MLWVVEADPLRRIHPLARGSAEPAIARAAETGDWSDLIDTDDRAALERAYAEAARSGSVDVEFSLRLPDGRIRRIAERGPVLPGARGPRVLAVGVDITAGGISGDAAAAEGGGREAGMPAARFAAEPAAHADGLTPSEDVRRTAGELLAPLAHDLRSGLTGILGWAQVLERVTDEPARTRSLDGIRRAVGQQTRLAEDVAEAGRLIAGDQGPKADVDFVETMKTAAVELESVALARRVRVVFLDGESMAPVRGHPAVLQRLARLLLLDAIAQVPMGASLWIGFSDRGDRLGVDFGSELPEGSASAEESRATASQHRASGNVRRAIAALLARIERGSMQVNPGGAVVLNALLPRSRAR